MKANHHPKSPSGPSIWLSNVGTTQTKKKYPQKRAEGGKPLHELSEARNQTNLGANGRCLRWDFGAGLRLQKAGFKEFGASRIYWVQGRGPYKVRSSEAEEPFIGQ